MNAPHDYKPMFRAESFPPIDTMRSPSKPKTMQALVMVHGHGFTPLNHAARGHAFAFLETGSISRWIYKRGAASPELFADLITAADARGRRWRIVKTTTAEIVSEG